MTPKRRRKFLSYYKPYRWRFVLVLLTALIAASMAVVFPQCVRYATDVMLGSDSSINQLLPIGAVMLVVLLIETLSNFYYDYFGHSMGAEMENDMRQELFAHLEKMPYAFYDTHRVGELTSSLTNDLNELAELYHHGPEDYTVASIQFLGASIALFAMDWRLALLMYAFLPVMGLLTMRLNRYVRRASDASQENIAQINAFAEDALSGIRVSQTFNRQQTEQRRFEKAGASFTRSRKDIYLAESIEYQTLNALTRLMVLSVMIVGLIFVQQGSMHISELVAFILYVSTLTDPVKKLAWMTTQFQRGLAGFERVAALLEIQPAIQDTPAAKPLTNVRGDITFSGVTFQYDKDLEPVINDVNLHVQAGECLAVVGASGVGKTTLCALIPRFYEAQSGSVRIDGRNVQDITLSSLRDAISLVPQDTYLFSGTVRENIRYGCENATDEMVLSAAKLASADEFITALPNGYDTDVGPRGVRLSGGQRQRIAIARAFLKNAPILILDEASSALDSESERYIHEAIARMRKGRTILLIAHRLSTVKQADRICVLQDGRIVEEGDYAALMAKDGEFTRLYRHGEA